jgi:hypothetical protein
LSLEAIKREDSKAINCIAEEASVKDRTGWFKRTQWDEHLHAYPDWKLLAYAIRLTGDDELALKQVVLAVEELVEQAVSGLHTLSIDTLRWLKSAKPNEADARPLSRMQNKDSQQRAARLWARLLCYCVRLGAAAAASKKEEAVVAGAGRHCSPLPLVRKAEAGGEEAVEDLLAQGREH